MEDRGAITAMWQVPVTMIIGNNDIQSMPTAIAFFKYASM